MTEKSDKTYPVECECENCDYSGTARIKKGTPVPEKIVCPNCSCETAKRKQRVKLPDIKGEFPEYPWDKYIPPRKFPPFPYRFRKLRKRKRTTPRHYLDVAVTDCH